MASQMIGRRACPWCEFGSAHVKRSEKCLYLYCPECGAQHYARTERQEADLMKGTRPEPSRAATGSGAPPAPAPAPSATPPTIDATPTGSEPPAPPAAPRRRGLFG